MKLVDALERNEEKLFFWKEGYVVIRSMFSKTEMHALEREVLQSEWYTNMSTSLAGMNKVGNWGGGFASLNVTNDCTGDDVFSLIGRSYKILDRSSHYYEDDVYCYHNKISAKPAGAKGFRPHQDYGGYWKDMGVDIPDPHALFIAITPCTKPNGCLEVVPGSHLLGPVAHTQVSADSGIEDDTWKDILGKGYYTQPIELEAGDAVFFHGNTIHLSGDNQTANPRIGYVVTLNTRRASPVQDKNYCDHPLYTRMKRFYGSIATIANQGSKSPFFV